MFCFALHRQTVAEHVVTSRADVREQATFGSAKPRRQASSTARKRGLSVGWGRGLPVATAVCRRHTAAPTEQADETPNKRLAYPKRISPSMACCYYVQSPGRNYSALFQPQSLALSHSISYQKFIPHSQISEGKAV